MSQSGPGCSSTAEWKANAVIGPIPGTVVKWPFKVVRSIREKMLDSLGQWREN
jgi:hypothetical protein